MTTQIRDVSRPLENAMYLDRYELTADQPFESIEDFTTRFICEQPSWLTALSMGMGSLTKREAATSADSLDNTEEQEIGNWSVISRTPTTLILGEDMGPLEYHLTFALETPNHVVATTEVLRWSTLGRLYWSVVQRTHRRLFPLMLRNAGGASSTTTGGKVF